MRLDPSSFTLSAFRRGAAPLAAALLLACVAYGGTARAAAITYDFAATANGGPLTSDVFNGVLTVDSSAVASGSGSVVITSFNVFGTILTGAEAAFGQTPQASFALNGALTGISNFVVLSTARANSIGDPGDGHFLPSPISSLAFNGQFNYGTNPSQGELFTGGAVAGSVATAVPEPDSLLLLAACCAAGLAGAPAARRRRLDGPAQAAMTLTG